MTETKQRTCKQRIKAHWLGRKADLEAFMNADDLENAQLGDTDNDRQSFYEYGLSFDYVPAGTFNGQRQGFWRYQLSWGGPSDEIRFYGDPEGKIYRAEYRFHDWFDGAGRTVTDEPCISWLIDWFSECGSFEAEREKATA